MTPFRNNNNFLDSTRSLGNGRLSGIIDASMFYLIALIDEAGRRTFQVNEQVGLFFRCFACSESFCVSSCSCHLISTFLIVSPIYDSWQEHTPLYLTHDGWGFLLFNLNNCLTFLVIHLIQISYLLSVKTSNIFLKLFENSSFFGHYGISTNTTFFGTSKKAGGTT